VAATPAQALHHGDANGQRTGADHQSQSEADKAHDGD
jgi:hypothetical protein